MTNQEEFAARLARVREGAANTKGTVFIGQDERHHIVREIPQKQAKGKEIASNAVYPLSLAAAFGLGLFGAAFGIYARFQLMSGREALTEDADLEMILSGVVGMMLSFVLAQVFRLTSKEHRGLQGIGVFVMICSFHNFAHWVPGLMAVLFSPAYVAEVQTAAPANSAKFRGTYFPLFEETNPATALADAGGTTESPDMADCQAYAQKPEITVLQVGSTKKPAGTGHKTVTAAAPADTGCATP